jgi:dihydrofolate synthase / folylpolyglutamate synthase
MEIKDTLNKLFALHTFGMKLGIDNIKSFLERIGNPQKNIKAFHIAGSNGKGSTSAFIASILMEFDCKVGLYTSPHFVRFNERISINGREISDKFIADFYEKHVSLISSLNLTFFEVTTAMAFKYFEQNNVDFAVIETGLGGRLDATNVISPLAAVITSISLEHTNILGTTIKEIASEKAGIIKKNMKVFTGKIPDEAAVVIEEKCNANDCELFKIEDYTNITKNSVELYTEEIELDDWTMPLKGDYQKFNAAVAALAVTKTLDENDFNTIGMGIKNVIKNTQFQGRYEFYRNSPDIILDSAHNSDGVKNFISEFKKDSNKYNRKSLLFGCMKDKNVYEMLLSLKGQFDEVYLTQIDNERAMPVDDLKKTADEIKLNVKIEKNIGSFITEFEKGDPENCLVVLGSMYLVGEIKSLPHRKFA